MMFSFTIWEVKETSQMMVVALYNLFVEQLHLKRDGLECLRKALQVAKQRLGASDVLTLKMQEVIC